MPYELVNSDLTLLQQAEERLIYYKDNDIANDISLLAGRIEWMILEKKASKFKTEQEVNNLFIEIMKEADKEPSKQVLMNIWSLAAKFVYKDN